MKIRSKKANHRSNTVGPLAQRSAVFVFCFVIISGIIGPRIISHGLVYRYGFEVYGGAGKAVLFGAIALLLLIRRKASISKLDRWQIHNLVWLGFAVLLFGLSLLSINQLIGHKSNIIWPFLANTGIVASVAFSMLFSFGVSNLRKIFEAYRRELGLSFAMAIGFFFFLYLVYGLWTFLASTVLNTDMHLLNLFHINAIYFPPRTLLLSKFAITVSEFCSGVDSIALFSALYALIGILDWRRFSHTKYTAIFVPALLVLFGCNIIRVFLLIIGGYYINPQIAFSIFHTYAGLIFFILYSTVFWRVTYGWMLRESSPLAKAVAGAPN